MEMGIRKKNDLTIGKIKLIYRHINMIKSDKVGKKKTLPTLHFYT